MQCGMILEILRGSLNNHEGCEHMILNIDNTHFFISRKAEDVTEEEINRFIDQYAGTQVSQLLFSINAMRASYDSQVFEPMWQGYDPEGGPDQPFLSVLPSEESRGRFDNMMQNFYQLCGNGKNVFQHWIAKTREAGISPWISTRMNDIHEVNDERHPFHSEFWREHPEARRSMYHDVGWSDRALDFGRQDVRDRHFAFIEEIMELYNIDGLELDWMRFGYHFRPGFEEEGAALLTEFTADVRHLLDTWETKRGHKIELSARVPSRPATSLALGLDAMEWARRGLVSRLVITPFWATSEADMPVEIWKRLLYGTDVKLEAGLEVLLRAYPASKKVQTNSLETVRGAAMALLSRGADDLYLFNYFDCVTCMDDLENYPTLLREVGELDTLRGKPRRHVVTYSDTWAVGEPAGYLLPATVTPHMVKAFAIPIGEAPAADQQAYVVLGVAQEQDTGEETVWVNGTVCQEVKDIFLSKPLPASPARTWMIPARVLHKGRNVVEIQGFAATLDWVEIKIV